MWNSLGLCSSSSSSSSSCVVVVVVLVSSSRSYRHLAFAVAGSVSSAASGMGRADPTGAKANWPDRRELVGY